MLYQLSTSLAPNLERIASCHAHCFPDSFSAKLGLVYSHKTFEWFLADSNRFLFHISADGKVVGYCGGFCPRKPGEGSTSGMLQFAMREAVFGIMRKPWLLLHRELYPAYPVIFKNIFARMFKTGKPAASLETKVLPLQRVGLVVVGVLPEYRGKGIFPLLMQEFEKQAALRGIQQLYLSVKKDNLRAIHAYKKEGWRIYKEHKTSLEMQKQLIYEG